jgi:DNA repair protein RadD
MQGIVYGVDRQHSRDLADAFNAAGVVAAVHLDGETPRLERKVAIDRFRSGQTTILCNVELFCEGFDVPGVSYVGLARPTQSLALHLQMVGRALRVTPGKAHAVICDHAGNALRLATLPDDERQWSLDGRKKGKRGATARPTRSPIRQCVECYRVSPSTADHCPGCGVVFPARARPACHAEGELFELERLQVKRALLRSARPKSGRARASPTG